MNSRLRKQMLLAIVLLFVSSPFLLANGQDKQDFNFRKTQWGMSEAKVVEIEGEPLDQYEEGNERTIYYRAVKADLNSFLYYVFVEDKLVYGGYVFTETYEDKNKYIDDFQKIQKDLTEKYGQPKTENKIWNKDTYKEDPEKHGLALSRGHLTYEMMFETEKTEITHTLDSEDEEILHQLSFFSKELKGLLEGIEG